MKAEMPRVLNLYDAVGRMRDEFRSAGHFLGWGEPDVRHPMHGLWVDTKRLLGQYCPQKPHAGWMTWNELDRSRVEMYGRFLRLAALYKGDRIEGDRKWEEAFERLMPQHAEMLAIRFATLNQRDNESICKLLAEHDWLHLWQIPRPVDDEAGDGDASPGPPKHCTSSVPNAVKDDIEADLGSVAHDNAHDTPASWACASGWSSSVGAPKEPDSIDAALKLGLGDTERQVKAIQNAKKVLQSKLAIVEKAETAVLKAQDAIAQAQTAMTQSDLALLQSQMSSLAMDSW